MEIKEKQSIEEKIETNKVVERILDYYRKNMEKGYLRKVFELQEIVGVPIPKDTIKKGYETLIKKSNCCYGPRISEVIKLKRRTGVNIPKDLVLKAYKDRIEYNDEFCDYDSGGVEYDGEAAIRHIKELETLVKETGTQIPKNIILKEYKRQQKNLRCIHKTGSMYVEAPIFKLRVLKKLLDKKKIINFN